MNTGMITNTHRNAHTQSQECTHTVTGMHTHRHRNAHTQARVVDVRVVVLESVREPKRTRREARQGKAGTHTRTHTRESEFRDFSQQRQTTKTKKK